MTMHKQGVVFLLFLTGAIPVALSGCRCSRMIHAQAATSSGPVKISQMGGDIDVADAPNGAELTTMGGNIHLQNAGSFAKMKTMGGNIAVDSVDGSVDASTMGGKITISRAIGAIQASTMGGDVTAHVVGTSSTRRDIELSSKGGTIELTVPKDFPMDVRVTLAYTKKAGDHFRIINHIALAQRETQEWDNSFGSPRKYIRATGRVGSGLNHVTIETVNGDVILRQE
jgi:DUF4097 and DUF4098 domain-containing protein YvlB